MRRRNAILIGAFCMCFALPCYAQFGNAEIARIDAQTKLFGQTLDRIGRECGGPKYDLPSNDFNRKIDSQGIDDFYNCFEKKFPPAALAIHTDDYTMEYLKSYYPFQHSIWKQLAEKSITPAVAAQEMTMYDQKLRLEMKLQIQMDHQ